MPKRRANGEGNIRKRKDGRWEGRYTVGHDPETGKAIISERENKCMEYDDSIVRQMVECIKAYPGGKLEIIFGGGYLVEESV